MFTNVRAARGTNVASFYPDVPLQEETKSKRKKMPSGEPIDAEEAAKMLGLTARTVTTLAEKGKIPGFRVGKHWRFRQSDIQEYIERQIRYPQDKPIDDQEQRWIEELQRKGLSPLLQVLETIETVDDRYALAREREEYWISEMKRLGCPLLNVFGFRRPYATRGKRSIQNILGKEAVG